jgi:PAS domain S-box-containing protein
VVVVNVAMPRRVDGLLVLLVDDNEIMSKLTRVEFERAGFRVAVTTSAGDALRLASVERPDAIVSDIVMGQVDGFSLCRMFRADTTLASVPIVLLSSYFDEQRDKPLARAAGASDLIRRTPDVATCIDAVVRLLRGGGQFPSRGERPSSVPQRRSSTPAAPRSPVPTAAPEDRYYALLEQASDAVAILAADGVVVTINKTWEALTGKRKSALLGVRMRDIAVPWAPPEPVPGMPRNGSTSIAIVAKGDGRVAYLEMSETRVSIGGAISVLSIGRDITAMVEGFRRSGKLEATPASDKPTRARGETRRAASRGEPDRGA